jgi:hypothetical protein
MSDDAVPSSGPQAPNAPAAPKCLCMGLGPELTELVAKLSGRDDVCQQVKSAWIDVLRAVQALIDAHLASLAPEQERKGTRLTVE